MGWKAHLALLVCTGCVVACGGDSEPAGPIFDARPSFDADPRTDNTFLFDESVVRTFNVTVAEPGWSEINEGDNALLEQYVPATLEFEGETFEDVAFRYKGSIGSLRVCFQGDTRVCDKLSIKLKFNEYVPGKRFFGLKRINFHAMNSDPSKMHDAISYKLFRDRGVFAPRTSYVRFVVNGELLGLYIMVEAIDGRFTRRVFPDGGEGNLYKEVWPEHLNEQPYINALKTNEDENPSAAKIRDFAQELMNVSDENFEALLDQWTDSDMFFNYFAVARAIDHWDGTVGWYCFVNCFNHNYYWYESSAENRLWLIPWDLDHTFEEPSPIRTAYGMPDWDENLGDCDTIGIFGGIQGRPPGCDPFLRRVVQLTWDRYASASQALLDAEFSPQQMNARIDELVALIEGAVIEDPDLALAGWENAVMQLRSAYEAKRTHIENKLTP